MKKESENQGLLGRLFGGGKAKEESCCCGFEIEEISDENENIEDKVTPNDGKGSSCCK